MTSRNSQGGSFHRLLSWLRSSRGAKATGIGRPATRQRARRVWFYREYRRLTGGHLKHSHYFHHVLHMPGFAPMIAFGGEPRNAAHAREQGELWPAGDDGAAVRWEPERSDVLFLEGASDWPYLFEHGLETLSIPRINFIQGVRHAREDNVRYRYLTERAIRICVSREVADAITATGRTNGPVLTIPNGIDVAPFAPAAHGSPAGYGGRHFAVTILGYKSPDLARALSGRLNAEGIDHLLLRKLLDRSTYLGLLAESRVAVCLPYAEEGFYLPALEAMAAGCLVVTLDCIGNRGFCRHNVNCLVAEGCAESLYGMAKKALGMPEQERGRMHRGAREAAAEHSLDVERTRFHAVLGEIDRIWETG